MEIIKKYYQKIISYGLIALGILAFILISIVKPQKLILKDACSYNQSPTLSSVTFPLSYNIKINSENLSFIQLYFGDDSITQSSYVVSVTHDTETLFEHTYINEPSNIIRLFLEEPTINQGDLININIDCLKNCKNTKIALYNVEDKKIPRLAEGYYQRNIGLFWYSAFLITVGLTLLPLTKRSKK